MISLLSLGVFGSNSSSRLLFNYIKSICILVATFCLFSCRVWNPNQIYKSSDKELYPMVQKSNEGPYVVQPGDLLSMLVYTNNGYKLVDAGLASLSGGQGGGTNAQLTYLVELSGLVRFPIIDTVMIAGYTLLEAAERLEARYSKHLVEPWVQLQVENRRAFVFRGSEQASVVSLANEDMTLLEVIASAGGIPATGKAYKIKLIRKVNDISVIYRIDLRDDANLQAGQTIIRANDVILIDPTFESTLISQVAPFLGIITSGIAVFVLLNGIR